MQAAKRAYKPPLGKDDFPMIVTPSFKDGGVFRPIPASETPSAGAFDGPGSFAALAVLQASREPFVERTPSILASSATASLMARAKALNIASAIWCPFVP